MPYFNPTETCLDCGERALILDAEPSDLLTEDGSTLMRFPVPRALSLDAALRISAAVRGGQATDPLEKLIYELTSGLIASLELLSRIVVFGVDGTGDVESDDANLDAALSAAHDYCLAFGSVGGIHEVQLDASNFLCFLPDDDDAVPVYSPPAPIEA